jgi:hypothetical protein
VSKKKFVTRNELEKTEEKKTENKLKIKDMIELLEVSKVLEAKYAELFPYEFFNHMQSIILPQSLGTDVK